MKVLLDENLPHFLKGALRRYNSVETVQGAGWNGIKNGALLALAETRYDVFITADQSLRYQQNLVGRKIAIIELPTNLLSEVKQMVPVILTALTRIKSGDYLKVEDD
jgi:predicted nuclease of predicted toxin-antitoxin system